MITAPILAALSASLFGASPFVDTSHTHAWEFMREEESGQIWWDRNYRGTRPINNRNYSTILLRVVVNEDHWVSEMFKYQDIVAAIDCKNAQIAEVEEIRNGQRVTDPWNKLRGGPEFSPLPDPKADQVQSMMRIACGEDWIP